jgi:tRNA guanosine-2'-O-methyltransferase
MREKVQYWLSQDSFASSCIETPLLKKSYDFPEKFISNHSSHSFVTFDDEDPSVWKSEAQRWARMLFLIVSKESQLEYIFSFVRKYGLTIIFRTFLQRQDQHILCKTGKPGSFHK